MQAIKVAIVEDNKSFREGLAGIVEASPGFSLSGSYANANSIVKDLSASLPDVVLMDIQMPGTSGIEAVKQLKQKFPELKVIIQTVFEDNDNILNAICNGASGYILKTSSPADYLSAIQDVHSGGAPMSAGIATRVLNLFRASQQKQVKNNFDLTQRETEILDHLVKGLSYKMIAAHCSISYDTVRFHMKNIYAKLQVESMTEAVSFAIKNNLV